MEMKMLWDWWCGFEFLVDQKEELYLLPFSFLPVVFVLRNYFKVME